jgi:hypothetical protein
MRGLLQAELAQPGMQLAALPFFEGGVTQSAEVCGIELMRVKLLWHPYFMPQTILPLHECGGEGIEQLVVIDECLALSVGERGFEVVVPVNFAAEPLLLLYAENGGGFDDVKAELAALPPAERLADGDHERAIARANFDDVADARLCF